MTTNVLEQWLAREREVRALPVAREHRVDVQALRARRPVLQPAE